MKEELSASTKNSYCIYHIAFLIGCSKFKIDLEKLNLFKNWFLFIIPCESVLGKYKTLITPSLLDE